MNSVVKERVSPLRIAHVTKTLDSAAGGVPVVAIRLAAAAAEAGHKVTLIAEGPEVDLRHERISIHGFESVSVRYCSPGAFGSLFGVPDSDDELVAAIRQSDVLHMHGVWDPILVRAGKVAYRYAVPYVVAPHGMLDPWSLSQSSLKKKIALATTHRSLLAKASVMHALNDTEAALWAKLALRPPTAVVPNGIDLRELPAKDPSCAARFRSRFGIRERKSILFLGRLHHKKGLDILSSVFERVATVDDDIALVVVGPDDGAQASFEAAVAEAGLSSRVYVLGPLFGGDKYDAMFMADFFCLPSRQEGFSIAILEALACGLPVVISSNCHFDEVEDAGVGRVCPLESKAIAEALIHLAQDDEQAASMRAAGPAWVEENYTWSQANRMLTDLYHHYIKSVPRS